MDTNENARPATNGTGGERVDQTMTSLAAERGGDPVVTRRRHARQLAEHLADVGYVITPADVLSLTIAPPLPDLAPCGGQHSGPCDWWSSCTGVNLTYAERDAGGVMHPWRVVA